MGESEKVACPLRLRHLDFIISLTAILAGEIRFIFSLCEGKP